MMEKMRKNILQAPFYSLNISCKMLNQFFYEFLLIDFDNTPSWLL